MLGIVVYRRMVRQALANAAPPERQPRERKRPIMAPLMPFIDAVLEADSNARASSVTPPIASGQRIVTEQRRGKCRK